MDSVKNDSIFVGMFKGLDNIDPTGESLKKAMFWLMYRDVPNISRKTYACVLFYEKPTIFLITGKTRKGEGPGRGVEECLEKYLPMLEKDDLKMSKKDLQEFRRKRAGWGVFKNVNLSMVRNVALFSIEASHVLLKPMGIVRRWLEVYGSRPSYIIDIPLEKFKGNEESRRIKMEGIRKFQEDLSLIDQIPELVAIRRLLEEMLRGELPNLLSC